MLKTCLYDGCNKKHYAKGYCNYHYTYFRNTPQCTICKNKSYAKGLCRNHYLLSRRHLKFKKCYTINCNIKTVNTYCYKHLSRIKRGLPLDLNIKFTPKGERNGRWRGGVSEYKNHYEMKKIRIEILKKSNYKCFVCNREAKQIHHLDKIKMNHAPYNLIAVCPKCHISIFHKGECGRPKKTHNQSICKF